MAASIVEVREVNPVKGRGVFGRVDLEAGAQLMLVHPDITALYTPFASTVCAECFQSLATTPEAQSDALCSTCQQFAMCRTCRETPRGESALSHHAQVCQWFMTLPEATRAGDTDYLRFLLEYAARVQAGDLRVALAISECSTNEASQTAESRQFCESYAKLVATHFRPHGLLLDQQHLRDTLLRVKCNALGFPFNNDTTLGWSMQGDICMLNHSCLPNCALRQTQRGEMELLSTTDIAAGEELTISYLHLPEYAEVAARSRFLLEKYQFLCKCEVCSAQRDGRLPASLPLGLADALPMLRSILRPSSPVASSRPALPSAQPLPAPMSSVE